MLSKPQITVIIINWNGLDDTIECVKSLKTTDYENYKITIVDNNSNEFNKTKLKELQENYKDITLIFNESNLGFSGGNNIGIQQALREGADYILLLNNDTIVEPSSFSKLISVFEHDINAGIASPKINYYDFPDLVWSAGGKISKIRGSGFAIGNIKSDSIKEEIKEVSFVSGCCMLIKKDLFNKVGLLDEDFFLYLEDTDFCVRVKEAGFKIYVANNSVIYHKVSKSTFKLEKPISLYYTTRNRLLLVNKHFKHYLPLTFTYIIVTMLIKSLYWIFIGKSNNVKAVFYAIIDFLQDKKGIISEEGFGKL
ncbi:glycosyltransferase family 2 protein [Ignavibacterium sp.]|uniref:glycosyltransferase family 2 protein n=1 Tax=Ignavibacterium sp. TaxID=2651167 RepID=UPI00220B546E|nr:glycosyltransferase family 2 protein [Ignavibacterium sp.]BDQ04195.1 MAG: glycosyl transferase [Ignavibacterium sp.]